MKWDGYRVMECQTNRNTYGNWAVGIYGHKLRQHMATGNIELFQAKKEGRRIITKLKKCLKAGK